MKIEYKLIEVLEEKNIQPLESFVELTNEIFHWRARYYCDIPEEEEDPESNLVNRMKSHEVWVKKAMIIGVGKSYLFRQNVWQVFMDASGLAGTIEIYFKRESEATQFASQITDWMLS